MSSTRTTPESTTAGKATYDGFTEEERAAMKQRSQELKASARRGSRAEKAAADAAAVLEKIAEMEPSDRALAERIHAIVQSTAPDLEPKLWYGMPSYARDGKVVCFFQDARKFKSRYATLGFSDQAHLDEGTLWPTSYALTELTAAAETRIADLVRRAAG
ncbi:iron chaperone [Kitasatospora sp. NPDC090091]|uniref:iron chaperone n=1 Tax=Kitasatospora sp. NPDC090091 TaxID=3364081 RepID=UPI0037FAA494